MNFLNNYRNLTKIFRSKAVKALFFILFFGILYFQLRARGDWSMMWEEFKRHLGRSSGSFLLVALLLVIINLLLESVKWRFLVSPFQKMNLSTSLKAVLSGMSLALVTPARLGEFGGRMLGLKPINRPKGVWAMAFGSYLQTVIIFWLGWLALDAHPEWIENPYSSTALLQNGLFVVGIGLVAVAIFHDWLIRTILRKQTRIGRFVHKGYFGYDLRQMAPLFCLTLLRFVVYSVQFYLLNLFFGLPQDLELQFSIIFAIFLFQAFFPLPAMLGLLMKSEIALFLWSSYHVNEISILSGTFFLWIINVLLPGLIGLLYLRKIFHNKTKQDV